MKKLKQLSPYALFLGPTMYRVVPFSEGLEEGFTKGNAYREESDLSDWILPFIRSVKSFDEIDRTIDPPGIYTLEKNKDRYIVIYPTGEQAGKYKPNRIVNLMEAVRESIITGKDQFIDMDDVITTGGDWFQPPIRDGDDALNVIIKAGIGLKQVPFAAYGPRMEREAIGSTGGMDGTNVRNNNKKALQTNGRMSATKACYFAKCFDLQMAIIIRDVPGAENPMFDDGSAVVIYPEGEFPIDPEKLIPISEIMEHKDIYFGTQNNDSDEGD